MSAGDEFADLEWVDWTPEVAAARPELRDAIKRFASLENEAGQAAAEWLRENALDAHPGCQTRVLFHSGAVQGFYSLTMGEVELRSADRKAIGGGHPRQGAVLIVWLARAAEPTISQVADHLLKHAVGVARRGADYVGASVIALDPYNEATVALWAKRGFKNSLTQRRDKPHRMWQVLGRR